MPQNPFHDKSLLVQVMAWCRQATSHYLIQCWPRFMASPGHNELIKQGLHVCFLKRKTTCRLWIWNHFPMHMPVHNLNQATDRICIKQITFSWIGVPMFSLAYFFVWDISDFTEVSFEILCHFTGVIAATVRKMWQGLQMYLQVKNVLLTVLTQTKLYHSRNSRCVRS